MKDNRELSKENNVSIDRLMYNKLGFFKRHVFLKMEGKSHSQKQTKHIITNLQVRGVEIKTIIRTAKALE